MPRSTKSPAGSILSFFQTTELTVANTVLDLVKDVMRERNQKSQKARVRATAGTPTATADPADPTEVATALPRRRRTRADKGTRRRRAAAATPEAVASEPEPAGDMYGDLGEPVGVE